MKVIIFGASGGIGKWAVKYSLQKKYEVTAYLRNPDKLTIKDANLTVIKGEITDYKTMCSAIKDHDAVIWCVGISMSPRHKTMDSLEGHKNLVKAMQETGVKRLIDWATPSIPFKDDKKSFITIVPGILAGIALPRAKKEMIAIGELIEQSNLDWTLVRFMAPQNSSYTGKVKVGFGDIKMSFAISREDIGAFMVEQVESHKYLHSMPIIGS